MEDILLNSSNKNYKSPYKPSNGPGIEVRAFVSEYEKKKIDLEKASKHAIQLTSGSCLYCGKRCFEDNKEIYPFEYDHFYPASRFNVFDIGNAVIACRECNNEKSDRDPFEYSKFRFESKLNTYYRDFKEFCFVMKEQIEIYKENYPWLIGKSLLSKEEFYSKTREERLSEGLSLYWSTIIEENQNARKKLIDTVSNELLEEARIVENSFYSEDVSSILSEKTKRKIRYRIHRIFYLLEKYSKRLFISLRKDLLVEEEFSLLSKLVLLEINNTDKGISDYKKILEIIKEKRGFNCYIPTRKKLLEMA